MKPNRRTLLATLTMALLAGCPAEEAAPAVDASVADAADAGPAGDVTDVGPGVPDADAVDAGSTPDAGAPDAGLPDDAVSDAADAVADAPEPDAGGPDGSAGPDTVTPPDPLAEALCLPLATVQCQAALECGCKDPFSPGGVADEETCVERESARCLETLAPIADLLAAGVLHVVPALADDCREAAEAAVAPCEELSPLVTSLWCRGVFSTAAALGGPCDGDICAEGLGWCDGGTCAPLPAGGQPCQGLCAAGLLCAPGGVCAPPAQAGDPCTPEGLPCAPPLHCIGGTCRGPLPVGDPCEVEAECAPGLVCAEGLCAEGPTGCEPESPCGAASLCFGVPIRECAAKLGAGTPCQSDEVCAAGTYCSDETEQCTALPGDGEPCAKGVLCGPELACAEDFGSCGPLPGLGAPCAFGLFGPTLCAADLGCVDGTCAPLPGPDQPCTLDNRCDDLDLDGDGLGGDLGCDFRADGSFCVPRRPEGGDCQNDLVCQGGLFCDFSDGTCAQVYAVGTPCSLGNECGPAGSCIPDDTGDFACQPLGDEPGDACFLECGGDLWCDFHLEGASCAPKGCLVLAP